MNVLQEKKHLYLKLFHLCLPFLQKEVGSAPILRVPIDKILALLHNQKNNGGKL